MDFSLSTDFRFGMWLGTVIGGGAVIFWPPMLSSVSSVARRFTGRGEQRAVADAVNRLAGEVRELAKATRARITPEPGQPQTATTTENMTTH